VVGRGGLLLWEKDGQKNGIINQGAKVAPHDAHNSRALTCLCIKNFFFFSLSAHFFLFFTISSSSSHSAYIKTIYSYVCAVRLIYKPSPCHPEKKCLCAASAADFSFSVTTRAAPTANYLFAAKNLRLYFTFFGSSLYLLLIWKMVTRLHSTRKKKSCSEQNNKT